MVLMLVFSANSTLAQQLSETAQNETKQTVQKINNKPAQGLKPELACTIPAYCKAKNAFNSRYEKFKTLELYRTVKMFLKVMFGVLISSIVIFFLLLFVRRFYSPIQKMSELCTDEERKELLTTPKNMCGALKNFLDKTK